ncbi:hypothetical protein D3C75_831330 [compost metagenome]
MSARRCWSLCATTTPGHATCLPGLSNTCVMPWCSLSRNRAAGSCVTIRWCRSAARGNSTVPVSTGSAANRAAMCGKSSRGETACWRSSASTASIRLKIACWLSSPGSCARGWRRAFRFGAVVTRGGRPCTTICSTGLPARRCRRLVPGGMCRRTIRCCRIGCIDRCGMPGDACKALTMTSAQTSQAWAVTG